MSATVYVDFLFVAESKNFGAKKVGERNGHQWCHLWSEDLGALHELARRLGLKREWFQQKPEFPHYDLTPGKRALALRLGAREKSLHEWIREKGNRLKPELHTGETGLPSRGALPGNQIEDPPSLGSYGGASENEPKEQEPYDTTKGKQSEFGFGQRTGGGVAGISGAVKD